MLAKVEDQNARRNVAESRSTPASVLELLAKDKTTEVRTDSFVPYRKAPVGGGFEKQVFPDAVR